MGAFSSITVLQKPQGITSDWSFCFEGITFDVHDAKVELDEVLTDFNQFSAAMCALESLIDYIDNNDGKLEKTVLDFVNQNGELSQALGIILPYSFATEADERAAGSDVKQAAEGNGEEQGFFAKAWEMIKKFFRTIKEAVIKVWNKITGNNAKNVQEAAAEVSNASINESPETMKKVASILGTDITPALEKREVRYLTIDQLTEVVGVMGSIANKTASIPADPSKFIEWKGNNNDVIKAFGMDQELATLGIVRESRTQNGVTANTVKFVRNYTEPKESIRKKIVDCYSNPNNRQQLDGIVKRFYSINEKIKTTIDNLTANSERILKSPEEVSKMAEAMAKAEWKDRPHIKDLRGKLAKFLGLGKSDEQIQATNDKIDARNERGKAALVEKKRGEIQAAMAFEKELADYCKSILVLAEIFQQDVKESVFFLNRVVKKAQGMGAARDKRIAGEKEAAEADAKAKAEAEANELDEFGFRKSDDSPYTNQERATRRAEDAVAAKAAEKARTEFRENN